MDVYVECFVEKEVTQKDKMRKTMWIALCVLTGFLAFMFSILMLPVFVVVLIMTILYVKKMGLLWEYTFNGVEFTVTRITMSRRKKMYSCSMERVQEICHYKEYRAPGQPIKNVKDFASGVQSDDLYIMTVNGNKGKEKVYFEPNKDMLQAMRHSAPTVVRVLPQYGR